MWVASVYVHTRLCMYTLVCLCLCAIPPLLAHIIYIYMCTHSYLCVCVPYPTSPTHHVYVYTLLSSCVCALQPLHPPTHLFSRENRNHSCAKWLFVCRVMYVLECVGMCWSVWWSVAECCRALQCSIESHKLKHIYTPSHTHTRAHTHTHTHTHARTNI